MISIQHIASEIGAQLMVAEEQINVMSLCSDSRADCSGKLFVAIPGDNFDGHDYVDAAKQAGAAALLVNKQVDSPLPQLIVDDIVSAMAACTTVWREHYDVPLIAITGSAGKTTVKEMLGEVLHAQFGDGVVTKGNFNNEIGVPLTMTRLNEDHKFAVIEMGMNHSGEISRLSSMAQPNFALINNAAAAHLEGVGTLNDVALAKGEIIDGLADDGVLFLNADDQFADMWAESSSHKNISFGLSAGADVRCEYSIEQRNTVMNVTVFDQQFDLILPLLGEHNVLNALAVIAVAHTMGVSESTIVETLANFTPPHNRAGRFELLDSNSVKRGLLIDDTYNANLASMKAAISLAKIESDIATIASESQSVKSIVVLSDIGELGEQAGAIHSQVGEYAQQQKIDELWVTGEFSQSYASTYPAAKAFVDKKTLIEQLVARLKQTETNNEKYVVLVKGSRFTEMEQVVEAVKAAFSHELLESNSSKAEGSH